MKKNSGKSIAGKILSENLSAEDVNEIIEALKFKKAIVAAVMPFTPSSETLEHFLERFWDYNKSPYVRDRHIAGQTIHRRYTEIMLSRARRYWIPRLGKKLIGEIKRSDIQGMLVNLATEKQSVPTRKKDADGKYIYANVYLQGETVNQVMRSATTALKWAYRNMLIQTDCVSGIMQCRVRAEKRKVLSYNEAVEAFSFSWKHRSSMLANLTAMCTGMRIGEVQALQIGDLGQGEIHVNHNWARSDGLKLPKNECTRRIKVNDTLMKLLREQACTNPFGQDDDDFVFWGHTKNHPSETRYWNEDLHKVLCQMNIPDAKKVTFHSWRHFFASMLSDSDVSGRKLQLVTGHKSLSMLAHYADHESEEALEEVKEAADRLFLPVLRQLG